MRNFLRRFRSEGGNVALLFALTLPLVAGGAGLGIETTYWYFKDLELQAASDAAAYAAAIDKRAGASDAEIAATAKREAVANGFTIAGGTVVVNTPPSSGKFAGSPDAVEVQLRSPVQRFFTKVFSKSKVEARARSVAVFQTAASACVLALHPSASGAAKFSGSSSLTLNGCSVMTNSVAADATITQGSNSLKTTCLISVGGVALSGANLTMTECDAPVTQAPPVADPYRNVPEPSASGPCKPDVGATRTPGIYCSGMSLSGTVNLQPGVYVVTGGNLKINANTKVMGEGVTIFFNGSSSPQINGSATIQVSAPTSGPYSGVLFMGDRESTAGRATFNGTADSKMTGAIYFANNAVEYLGDFEGENGCTQVVARTVEWNGNATFNADCTDKGMSALPAMKLVKLAE
ncbi:pilus assembly protein TadG-related protein [Caulobacter sp. 17J80-11]|uniref:pilus assembly protein TadG-related protein n=1 Tax=Caulobacter sp. 17J80-11 TaxID=2763502 RepID=UPI0016539C61|nr:pilus assembly protein TadG-related protein [Caulobacter sp. 17J80-11]MBC6982144.1 hypothetical protein [Caulobacter sp. 17J80-11]